MVSDESSLQGGSERSGVDLYFMSETCGPVESDASNTTHASRGSSTINAKKSSSSSYIFKSTVLFRPYFYVVPDFSHLPHQNGTSSTTGESDDSNRLSIIFELIVSQLHRLYNNNNSNDGGTAIHSIEIVYKQDLDELNHLSPVHTSGKPMLQLNFDTTAQLIQVRDSLRNIIAKNLQRRHPSHTTTMDLWSSSSAFNGNSSNTVPTSVSSKSLYDDEPLRYLTDLREYDVPYIVRVCTDMDIRAGTWYTVQVFDPNHSLLSETDPMIPNSSNNQNQNGGIRLLDPDRESKANPVVLAFDIECTKAPLKFPSAEVDEIFMISYMVSSPITGQAQGYLIVSRSVVASDIQNFDYTPKPNYPGPFHIFNELNEKDLLQRFFTEFRKHAPQVVVTYNGDFFDFPYVDARAKLYGMNLYREIGIELVGGNNSTSEGGTTSNTNNNNNAGTYRGRLTVHLDAFHWVQRDSYLPQGAQGLKAVTKYKLGYDPVEVDPEDMVRFAQEKPIHMATYSVSDAVATFYLYEMYVHLFIFSLCTIIPMGPEDVLGKGSGTLCEALLMVQACKKNIICPNKHTDDITKFHNGHLLESETYIGGKVECLETGVYRSDLENDFQLQPTAFQQLIDNVDRDLTFTIEVENGKQQVDVTNYNEVTQNIFIFRRFCHDPSYTFLTDFIFNFFRYDKLLWTN